MLWLGQQRGSNRKTMALTLKHHKTAEQLAEDDRRAEYAAARESERRSKLLVERYRKLYDEYREFVETHPDYKDRGICHYRESRWEYEHPHVTRSFTIRQQFIALNPERNRPISRATSDREIAKGILRYRRNCEWHGDADLYTLGFWLTLTENIDVLQMDEDLLTAWLGNILGRKARGQYGAAPYREVEI